MLLLLLLLTYNERAVISNSPPPVGPTTINKHVAIGPRVRRQLFTHRGVQPSTPDVFISFVKADGGRRRISRNFTTVPVRNRDARYCDTDDEAVV